MQRVQDELIKTIRSLVDLERSKAGANLHFEIVNAVALIFPRQIKEQLRQLVNGPVWDGDVMSKGDRGILFEMGIASRVCCKGEQGYTGARYIGYAILNKMKERQNAKQEESGMRESPSIQDLERLLQSEADNPVNIADDGSVREC